MKRIITILLALTVLLTGCGQKAQQTDTSYIKEKGKLVIGVTLYEPMNYKDGQGNWTGFDTEFAEAFCKKLGVEAEFVEIEWEGKFFELESKSIDCVWNGMTITDEAIKNAGVTDAYVKNAQVVVMDKASADGYKDLASMQSLKFAAESGSAGEALLKDAGMDYTAVGAQSDALLEVSSGSAQACVIDITMANAMTGEGTSYPNLVKAAELNAEEYGVAFRKDSNLIMAFNDFMKQMKADGSLQALAEKYGLTLAD